MSFISVAAKCENGFKFLHNKVKLKGVEFYIVEIFSGRLENYAKLRDMKLMTVEKLIFLVFFIKLSVDAMMNFLSKRCF